MFRSNRPRVRNSVPSLCRMPACKVLLPVVACCFLLKLFRKARRHLGFRLRASCLKFQRLFCSLCFSYGFCLVSNKRQNRRLYIVFLDFLQHFCASFCSQLFTYSLNFLFQSSFCLAFSYSARLATVKTSKIANVTENKFFIFILLIFDAVFVVRQKFAVKFLLEYNFSKYASDNEYRFGLKYKPKTSKANLDLN